MPISRENGAAQIYAKRVWDAVAPALAELRDKSVNSFSYVYCEEDAEN